MGALTLSGLWRHRFVVAADIRRPAPAFAVLGWFLFGAVTGPNHGALLVEIGHGFLPGDRASLWRWALGAGFGVTLYAAQ